MKKNNILHLVLKGDGITEVVAEDINIGLVDAGYNVTMVYLRDSDETLPKTVATSKVGLGLTTRFRFLFDWLALRRLSKLLLAGDYDVVLSHRYKPCILLMHLIRKFPTVEFVNVVHGTGHYDKASRSRAIKRLAHERFRFVCVSDAVAEFMRNRCGVGTTASSVEVIPNGIDVQELDAQQLSRGNARLELGLDNESIWIGFAGRLTGIKGVRELIQGFAPLAKSYPSARLAILGKGELRQELENLINSHDLQDQVSLLGQVPLAKRYFKAFDAFILPSYREGMSIALLEAMATGLPLLVSDIPMNTALVDENAIIFEAKKSESISAALQAFLETEPVKLAADGKANRRLAVMKYDIGVFRKNYLELIQELCGESRRELAPLPIKGRNASSSFCDG